MTASVAGPAFGFAELHGGGSRVTIIPALGGKIASLEMGGRQWLWRSDVLPDQEPVDGASYAETGDTGGYDECFPTAAACHVLSGVRRYGGLALPDHGELWTRPPMLDVETRGDGQCAICAWEGRRMPYRFTREVRVTASGEVRMRYAVENSGGDPLPFIWSAHPVFPLTALTKLDLPMGASVRVAAHRGEALHDMAPEFRWPHARLEKKIADFTHPDAVAKRYACRLFLDLPRSPTIVAMQEGADRLEVHVDGREVPNFAVWLNKKEWTPFKRGKPYLNFTFGPSLGAPDSLAEALGSWHGAQWLAPHARREWSVLWRARRIAPAPTS